MNPECNIEWELMQMSLSGEWDSMPSLIGRLDYLRAWHLVETSWTDSQLYRWAVKRLEYDSEKILFFTILRALTIPLIYEYIQQQH